MIKWRVTLEIENDSLIDESSIEERVWVMKQFRRYSSLHVGGDMGDILDAKVISVRVIESQSAKE